MIKKAKSKPKPEKKKELTIDDLKVGSIVPDLHDDNVEITDDLISDMRQFESEGKPKAIRRDKITGSFLFWRMNKDKPKKKKKAKKPKVKEEEIEVEEYDEEEMEEELIDEDFEAVDEEEEMEQAVEVNKLDELNETELEEEEELSEIIMEAYKEKYNVQTVKRESKKFRDFAEKYRESE